MNNPSKQPNSMKFELLLQQLHDELKEIKNHHTDIINQANHTIVACRKTLSKMSQVIFTTCFLNEQEEIHFFKKVKSQPYSQLIYHSELRYFEMNYPKASRQKQKKYIEHKIKKANKFFTYNLEFVRYIRENKTHLDAQYFTRKNYKSLNITDTKHYYRVPEFSTSHDLLLGKLYGYDYFINYLQNKLYNIENPKAANLQNLHKRSKIKWKFSNTDVAEILYALHSCGAVDGTIKELFALAEELLNIKLGDPYRTLFSIRSRKISQTKMLDVMTKSLLQKFEEMDA